MALVSMQLSAEEAKEYGMVEPAKTEDSDQPRYPYGLTISLDDDSLAKLGMTSPPAVGTVFTVTAKAVVTSASSYQTQWQGAEISSCLQITDMELASGGSQADARSLYPNSSLL